MSQQQLVPEPQDSDSQGNEEIYKRPYKSARNNTMPKDEHPSTFEEAIPPYSYRAQDRTTQNTPDPANRAHFYETNAQERQSRRRRFSPDGDALENGYQPYRQRQQAWAYPQRRRNVRVFRWVIVLILAIIFIKPLAILIGGLFLAGLTVLGFIILIPLIVLGALLLAGLVLAILGMVLGRAVWRSIWRW